MKHFFKIFMIFLLAFSTNSFAQKDTLAGKDYIELAKIINANIKDTVAAFAVSEYYIEKARKEKNLLKEVEGLHSRAAIYYNQQDPLNSAIAVDKMLEFVNENSLESFKAEAYQLAATIYLLSGQIQKSTDASIALLEIAKATNNEKLRKQAELLIDFIGSMGGDSENFIAKYKDKLALLYNNPPKEIKVETLEAEKMRTEMLIGDAYFKMKNGDSSAVYFKKSLQRSLILNDTCMSKTLYSFLGLSEVMNKAYNEAKKSFDNATKYCRPTTKMDSMLLGVGYGKLAHKQGNYKEAITELEKALIFFEGNGTSEAFMDDYNMVLADSYKEVGDLEKANFYFEKHVNSTAQFGELQDTIQRNIRQAELSRFQTELTQLKEEKENKQTYLNYLFLGASIIILGLLFFLLKFYRNKKANEIKFEALLAKIKAAEKPENIIDTKDEVLEETNSSDVSEEVTIQILDGLKKLEKQEYFLKQDCNSYNVAKKINTNTSYLSKVINSHYGKNFNTYINDLRINYAIVRLKNDVIFRSYSIQSIAEEIGYKSADSFSKYFKKDTGLNPSFYIKEIKNVA